MLFQDESEALTHPYLAHAWAKQGADLRVEAPGQARKVAMLGVQDAITRHLIVETSATKRSTDFIALLERIDREFGPKPGRTTKPVVLVIDNGPIHTSKASRKALAARSAWLTPEWLPKYAPELNDIEHAWRDLKRHFLAHQTFESVNHLDEAIATAGGTPLAVARNGKLLGIIHLKDIVKGGIRERFAELRQMGIRTVMITGDNPLTAAAIAAEAGVDDFLAQATPEDKLKLIRQEQAGGKLVAMCGDGTNDAPALAQADVGVAMNTGTVAAREAGNMVDLDSNPTKLIEIVAIGKQLLMTRGALTTFSIANDVAKYFAIIPAMFAAVYPALGVLNVMGLASPQSAILSAIIFNALIIIFLIPLALKGVAYRPRPAAQLLTRNLLIYGLGGVVVPFLGIKAIDLLVTALGLA